jgi:septal ring factor EnvC (AmiA/AmiB activator)
MDSLQLLDRQGLEPPIDERLHPIEVLHKQLSLVPFKSIRYARREQTSHAASRRLELKLLKLERITQDEASFLRAQSYR